MSKVSQFEDLFVWQKARELMRAIYAATRLSLFAKDFRLCAQIQSAAVSAMANIAEGFDRGRRAEFSQYLSMAKGSCGEVRSHLYVALDVGYIDEATFNELKERCSNVSGLIVRLRKTVGGWDAAAE